MATAYLSSPNRRRCLTSSRRCSATRSGSASLTSGSTDRPRRERDADARACTRVCALAHALDSLSTLSADAPAQMHVLAGTLCTARASVYERSACALGRVVALEERLAARADALAL
eukprot:5455078-Pleurochrysis_carterae.AAC.1